MSYNHIKGFLRQVHVVAGHATHVVVGFTAMEENHISPIGPRLQALVMSKIKIKIESKASNKRRTIQGGLGLGWDRRWRDLEGNLDSPDFPDAMLQYAGIY